VDILEVRIHLILCYFFCNNWIYYICFRST